MSTNIICDFCKNPIALEIIKRSPSLKYCSKLCNSRAWYLKSKKTNQSIFTGNPILGILWEDWFINQFGAIRPSRSHGTPFDFWWNGKRIDLKVANLHGKYPKWSFRKAGKGHAFVDEYICLALKDGKVYKAFRIPADEYTKGGMKVGLAYSKYDKYLFNLNVPTS